MLFDTLYPENTKYVSCANTIVSEDSFVAEWSHDKQELQRRWSEAVTMELSSIASFDPRPRASTRNLKER